MVLPKREDEWEAPGLARWVVWLVGIALLAAVVAFAIHFAEEREFRRHLKDPDGSLSAILQTLGVTSP